MSLLFATTADDTVDLLWTSPEETETQPLSPSNVAADHDGPPAGIPESIPTDQLYYWSKKWQADQNESLAELERGESRIFTSTEDAIRWLVEPTDD
jgi:hypothetical protein